jgi:putative ABC transport system permease protein
MSQLREFKDNAGLNVIVKGTGAWMATPELRRTLWVMLGAVFLLLLIASVNVTNLLFVRAASRARERAVRTALGAGRGDLIRESLTESLITSVMGALVGWALAAAMLAIFKAQDPGGIPRLDTVTINGAVLLFTLGVALIVALATGLLPAWRTPFGQITAALREGQRGSVGDRRLERTRAIFVALEVAVSVLLLVGAALLVRSLINVLHTDRGFATEQRLTAEVSLPRAWDPVRRSTVAQQILDGIGRLPEIQSVAAVSGPMLAGGGTGMSFAAATATGSADQWPWATWRIITPDYFTSIGLPLLAGRGFDERDKIGKPWRVIISNRLATEIWPGQNPVGQMATLWAGQGNLPAEVIGVVSDIREHRLDDAPTREVYIPGDETTLSATTLRLIMHTRGTADAAGPAVRALVKSVDGSLPVSRVRSVETLVNASVATRRFTMQLLAIFAALAAILALGGVAGVLAYAMSQRRKEMGLRLALGAHYGQLIALAMRIGLWPVLIGLAFGVGAALWLSRLLTSLLFNVTPYDPLTYAGVAGALLAAAAVACYLPARTVLHVDPASAMRTE